MMNSNNSVADRLEHLLRAVPISLRHPGLQLDKYSVAARQEEQRRCLCDACKALGDGVLLSELLARRESYLKALSARIFSLKTSSPLTLHLSRANALENAGICLHPIYGFTYLPGSGLKGMARAYAETVWLPAQKDQKAGLEKILKVFGSAEKSEKDRYGGTSANLSAYGESSEKPAIHQASEERPGEAGSVIFHDAWPTKWPKLMVDIVNNHHQEYYKGAKPPDDCESPNMVYFLSIGPGEIFSFALSKRNSNVSNELLTLAESWLKGALTYLGAGAKTNAGYGCFSVPDGVAESSPSPRVYETRLTLVSPAFLAGARQEKDDCELRGATLRGQLRWWWRTMHSGFIDWRTLRRLETAIWGSDQYGGAVRITVEPVTGTIRKCQYDPSAIARDHRLVAAPRGWISGLRYYSYGMESSSRQQSSNGHQSRWYVAPGAQWVVKVIARTGYYSPDAEGDERKSEKNIRSRRKNPVIDKKVDKSKMIALSPAMVLEQAKAALWLLCTYGGVGAKARKGFGSFADIGDMSLDKCKEAASNLRRACGLNDVFSEDRAESPVVEHLPDRLASSNDPWVVLDQIGYAVEGFARKHSRDPGKKVLGLPRRIGSRQVSDGVTRHASPVLFHVGKDANGKTVLRVTIYRPKRLLDESSDNLFEELTNYLKNEPFKPHFGATSSEGFTSRSHGLSGARGGSTGVGARTPGGPSVQSPRDRSVSQMGTTTSAPSTKDMTSPGHIQGQAELRNGDIVEAELLEEKTKKGGWKAKALISGKVGDIQNSSEVPADKKPGDRANVYVFSVGADGAVQFRWLTPEFEENLKRKSGGGKSGPQKKRR